LQLSINFIHCHKSKCGQCSRYGQKPRCTQADVEQREKAMLKNCFWDKVIRVMRRGSVESCGGNSGYEIQGGYHVVNSSNPKGLGKN